MRLEDQVVSLELSKRLKELGVKQESYFFWEEDSRKGKSNTVVGHWDKSEVFSYFSAFTVAELGEMIAVVLPATFIRTEFYKGMVIVECALPSGEWHKIGDRKASEGKTEADARAKLLIYLIKNNLIDFDGLITSYPMKL